MNSKVKRRRNKIIRKERVKVVSVSNEKSAGFDLVGEKGTVLKTGFGNKMFLELDKGGFLRTSTIKALVNIGNEIHIVTKNTQYKLEILEEENK